MNISQITGINSIKINNNSKQRVSLGLKPDTFERVAFKGAPLNINEVEKELKECKNFKNKKKFDSAKIDIIKTELQKAPEKWEPFRALIQNPKILGGLSCEIIKKDSQTVQHLSDLACKKKEDGTPRFTPFDIKALNENLKGSDFDKAKVLADCNMQIDDLIKSSQNSKIKKPEIIVDKFNDMEKAAGENLLAITFKTDDYDVNGFSLTAEMKDTSKKIELLNKDLKTIATEEVKLQNHPNGKQYQIKKTIDKRNHTVSKVRLEMNKKLPQPVLINEVRQIYDENGKTIRKEHSEQSKVPGILNITHMFPDGTKKVISSGSVDKKTGITTVKKDMTSLDGTHTQYLYEDDPQGNRIIDYKITDKNGKILLNNSQSFEVISDNKFISSKNDNKYEITVNEKEMNIKDLKNNSTSKIEFENYIDGNKEKIVSVLKKMSGEELISLGKVVKHMNGIDDILHSTYGVVNKRIKTGDNLFVMLHELGHAKDYEKADFENKETFMNTIYSNPKINAVYEEEKALFNSKFPTAQREHINYFIKTSEGKDGLQEAIAESNALLGTYNSDDLFSIRSQYLQQYFPKTIAALSEELNK